MAVRGCPAGLGKQGEQASKHAPANQHEPIAHIEAEKSTFMRANITVVSGCYPPATGEKKCIRNSYLTPSNLGIPTNVADLSHDSRSLVTMDADGAWNAGKSGSV
jgi:hypothetical protein